MNNQQIKGNILSILLLIIVTLVVYWQTQKFEFLGYDDTYYVSQNSYIQNGLNLKVVKWAFLESYSSNWHPITWLSHLLDIELYGLRAGEHHFTNVLIHILNSILLFLIVFKIRKKTIESLFVATLFALHPIHISSVAWISERKDILFTFFGFLSIYHYIDYTRKEDKKSYILTLLFFTLSLMSKTMLVTLPFLFLLFDFSILPRIKKGYKIFYEKLPFIIISILVSIIIIIAQKQGGSLRTISDTPIDIRLSNAFIIYIKYIGKLFYPKNLSIMYVHPKKVELYRAILSFIVLNAISLCVLIRRKKGIFFLGWFWFILTLIPVIGIVQIGDTQMADRYLYFPAIGIYLIVAYLLSNLFKSFTITIIISIIVPLSILSYKQLSHWKNYTTLLEHTIRVTPKNITARYLLYLHFISIGKYDKAEKEIKNIITLYDDNGIEHYKNLSLVYMKQNRAREAVSVEEKMMRKFSSNNAETENKLLNLYATSGDIKRAKNFFLNFYSNDKDKALNRLCKLSEILALKKKNEEAILLCKNIILIDKNFQNAYYQIAYLYQLNKRYDLAEKQLVKILNKWGGNLNLYLNLIETYLKLNKPLKALNYLDLAKKIEPKNKKVLYYSNLISKKH